MTKQAATEIKCQGFHYLMSGKNANDGEMFPGVFVQKTSVKFLWMYNSISLLVLNRLHMFLSLPICDRVCGKLQFLRYKNQLTFI